MIPEEAIDAAADALVASTLGDHVGINGEEFVEAALAALEAAAPHMLGEALRLADRWQEDFPYKARELRAALGATDD